MTQHVAGQTEPPHLVLEFYDGEYDGDRSALTHLCDVEGSVVPHGQQQFDTLEEVSKLLELCADKCSSPRPSGDSLTVFIGRKTGDAVEPLARLDVYARDGYASAGVVGFGPRWDSEPVMYSPDDDAVTIVLKILEGNLHRGD
jgi:hypothetical protein